jgi:hypothetical protein
MAAKFRPNVQRTAQILPEELWRALPRYRSLQFCNSRCKEVEGGLRTFDIATNDAFILGARWNVLTATAPL